jgi:hypothetical protein
MAAAVIGAWVADDHHSIAVTLGFDTAGTAEAPLDINLSTSRTVQPIIAVRGQPLNGHSASMAPLAHR